MISSNRSALAKGKPTSDDDFRVAITYIVTPNQSGSFLFLLFDI